MSAFPAGEAISTEPTPLRRRHLWTRFSAAHILMVLAFVLAALANLAVLRRADVTYPVAVAAVDLLPGRTVDPSDLRLVEIDADENVRATLITDPALALGRVVSRLIPAGDLIRATDLAASATSDLSRAMSVPVERSHAAGGQIAVGDRVDLISVVEGEARYVVTGAEVIDVSRPAEGALAAGGDFFLVIAVDEAAALEVAAALNTGQIEVLRSTGAPPVGVTR